MVAYTLTIVALAALASAIPHSHQHFHKHQNLARTDKLAPIAGRSVSYDGSCGSWGGMTCPAGSCCGLNGWCGTGDGFCGAGCQTGFGDCGSSSAPVSVTTSVDAPVAVASAGASSGALEVSPDGLCGSGNPYTCKGSQFGDSCSKWGYCGSNSSYSGNGCQSTYGTCGETVAPASAYAAPSTYIAASTITLTTTTTSDQADSTDAAIANKAPDHKTHSGYTQTTLQTLTKTLPASTATSTIEPAPTSPAESSPPVYSAPPTTTTEATTAPSAYSTVETSAAPPATSAYSTVAPAPSSSGGKYTKMYKGDGSMTAGWPSQDSWLSASDLWSANAGILSQSCDYFGVPNDSDAEIASMKKAVSAVASSSGVDERFIIAIMLQESNGCVRAPTTVYSHSNPGLFQSHEGAGSCNNAADGGVQNPCPDSEIEQMVKDGVEGTSSGDGLKQLVAACAGKGAQTYYEAARMYNSGSVDSSGNLGLGVATHCYSSDVANRLTGWSEGVSGCDPNTVGA